MKGERENLNWPEVFQGFEYLYNEVKKCELQTLKKADSLHTSLYFSDASSSDI
jgi:hypothetical protein